MFPKVKVKVKVGDDDHGHCYGDGQRTPLMGLKAIDFLSIIDFNSQSHPCPGQEHQVFPERRARFDNCRVENVAPRTVSASEGGILYTIVRESCYRFCYCYSNYGLPTKMTEKAGKLNVRSDEATKQNTRASPIPRAVLSSPSNDAMIRKKNKKLMEKNPASRITSMSPHPPGNAAPQKAAAKPSSYRSPKNAKISRDCQRKYHTQKRSQGVCDIGRKRENAPPC